MITGYNGKNALLIPGRFVRKYGKTGQSGALKTKKLQGAFLLNLKFQLFRLVPMVIIIR